jgi:hypothetical protein
MVSHDGTPGRARGAEHERYRLRISIPGLARGDQRPRLVVSQIDLTVMTDAIERLSRAANRFDSFAGSLRESQCTRRKFWARCRRNSAISGANKVYMAFERQFYYEGGINGHGDWHHVVFTRSAWHNTPLPLPGLSKSLQKRDWDTPQVRHLLFNMYRIMVLTTTEMEGYTSREDKQCGLFIRGTFGIRKFATRSWYDKLDKADCPTILLVASYLINLEVEREKC